MRGRGTLGSGTLVYDIQPKHVISEPDEVFTTFEILKTFKIVTNCIAFTIFKTFGKISSSQKMPGDQAISSFISQQAR